jgi:hypothetical protein
MVTPFLRKPLISVLSHNLACSGARISFWNSARLMSFDWTEVSV